MISPASARTRAREKIEQRRLAATVVADETDARADRYRELEIAEQRALADAMRHVARLKQRGHF